MKKILNIFLILSTVLFFVSCLSDEIENPSRTINTLEKATVTIDSVIKLCPVADRVAKKIDSNLIIKGIIVYDPLTKNLPSCFFIQNHEGTRALKISVYEDAYFSRLGPGDEVSINLKGLYLGKSYSIITVGEGADASYTVGRISNDSLKRRLIIGDYIPPKPRVLPFDSLKLSYVGTLITLDSVQFDPASKGKKIFEGTGSYTTRTILNNKLKGLVISTYKNFTFGDEHTPLGKGSITGILSWYSGTPQLVLRDMNDIIMKGDNPFFWYEDFSSKTLGKFKNISVTGDQTWFYDTKYLCATITGYVEGSRFANEDWLISEKIDLTKKTAVNLVANYKANYWVDWNLIEMLVSSDYDGTSSPNTQGTWTKVPLNQSTKFALGTITYDMKDYIGKNVYIAFKYRSITTDAMTFELLSLSLIDK